MIHKKRRDGEIERERETERQRGRCSYINTAGQVVGVEEPGRTYALDEFHLGEVALKPR